MPNIGEKKCIDSAEYVWTPISASQQPADISSKLSDIIDLLNVIASKMPGGSTSTNYGSGNYRSIEQDVDPRRNDWEITIGLDARNINIRVDQAIKLKLGSTSGDEIKIDPTESAFEITNLTIPISAIYVTTARDTNIQTNVRILAY